MYLQKKLDAARERERQTRVEGFAFLGSSVAIPLATMATGAAAVGAGEALGVPDVGLDAGGIILGIGTVAVCMLSPYARFGEAEEAKREVAACEELLITHETHDLRF